MAGFYKSYSGATDLHIPQSRLGAPTNPMVAKQLEEFGKLLNQGIKNVEIGTIDPTKFEQIPIQHFEEVRRLAKITDSHVSVHAPLIDLSGFPKQQEGERVWKEEQRLGNEQQAFSILERTYKLSNGENIPVVFHAGLFQSQEYGIPWDPKTGREGLKKVDEKTGKIVPSNLRAVTAVNQDTGDFVPLSYEEKYMIGKDKPEVWDPMRRLNSLNDTQWEDEKLKLLAHQKDIEEIKEKLEIKKEQNKAIEKTQLGTDDNYKRMYEANQRDIMLMSRHINEINRKLANDYQNVYDKFKRFAQEEEQKGYEKQIKQTESVFKEKLKEIKKVNEDMENIRGIYAKTSNEEEKIRLAKEHEERESELLRLSLEQSKAVVTNMANLPAPEVWRDVNSFAKEKASDTVANALSRLYKKLKDEGKGGEKKMPFIAMENFFINTPMSRGEDLRDVVMQGRKKLAEKLQKECKLSGSQAEKEAEKLIGATWDVGHINNLRKAGFEGEELKKEILKNTKAVADVTKHVHITDNFGFFDSHLAPGMGNVPIKEIMEELEKKWAEEEKAGRLHHTPRSIVEAGGFVSEIGQNPTMGILEFFGSPMYKMSASPYFWGGRGNISHTYSPYTESFIEFPGQHFSLYGSSFTTLPKTVGGQVGEEKSRFSGTPNQ